MYIACSFTFIKTISKKARFKEKRQKASPYLGIKGKVISKEIMDKCAYRDIVIIILLAAVRTIVVYFIQCAVAIEATFGFSPEFQGQIKVISFNTGNLLEKMHLLSK
jgi:hypothetical protein